MISTIDSKVLAGVTEVDPARQAGQLVPPFYGYESFSNRVVRIRMNETYTDPRDATTISTIKMEFLAIVLW